MFQKSTDSSVEAREATDAPVVEVHEVNDAPVSEMHDLAEGELVRDGEENVSKHPDATIGESELSLADIQKQQSHPVRWTVYILVFLFVLVAPYWYGRYLAWNQTQELIANTSMVAPRGVALLSWSVTVIAFLGLGMMVIDRIKWPWYLVFIVGLACEQFLGGMSLLKFNFWNSTYVMYGDAARIANAANLGIIAAALSLAVFAIIWVGMLVVIKKDSPLNVFTKSWVSFIACFVVEVIGLLIVLFGGLITTV